MHPIQILATIVGTFAALNLFYAVYLAFIYYAPMQPTRWTYHLRVRWWWVPSVKRAALTLGVVVAVWALWALTRTPIADIEAERAARVASEQAALHIFAQQQRVIDRLDGRLRAIERPEFFLPATTAKRGA